MCFSLAIDMGACMCGGRVMAGEVMCHPIGYGFERLDSNIGYMYRISSDNNCGRFFFFFEMVSGVGRGLIITLNISLKGRGIT